MKDFGSLERLDAVQDDNPIPTCNSGASSQPSPTLQSTPSSVDSGPTESQSQPEKSRKILIAGDSLLHRLNT